MPRRRIRILIGRGPWVASITLVGVGSGGRVALVI
jgi:hypothetical protein